MAEELDNARAEKVEGWRMEAANKAFDGHRKSISDSFGMVGGFGSAAMRAPALAAGAGIAGLLGFFSANRSMLMGTEGVAFFNQSIFYLCGCIALSVLAPGAAYFSQACFARSLAAHSFNYESPFVRETKASDRWEFVGSVFQVTAIILVLAAIGMMAAGGWYFVALAGFLAK